MYRNKKYLTRIPVKTIRDGSVSGSFASILYALSYHLPRRKVDNLFAILFDMYISNKNDKLVHYHEGVELLSSDNEFISIARNMNIDWEPINYVLTMNYSGQNIEGILSPEKACTSGYDSLLAYSSKITLEIIHPTDKSVSFISFYSDSSNIFTGVVELLIRDCTPHPIVNINDTDILSEYLNDDTLRLSKLGIDDWILTGLFPWQEGFNDKMREIQIVMNASLSKP